MNASRTWRLVLLLLPLSFAHANPPDGLGLGVMVGEPTGISLKKWTSADTALAAGLAWSFSENESLHFHADYLLHRFDALKAKDVRGRTPLYYGLGARVKLRESDNGNRRARNDDDALVGLRVPLGIAYMPANSRLDFFLEIVPTLDVLPRTDFDIGAAIGVRYFF